MSKKFWKDLAERSGWTFIQAAAGVATAAGGFSVEVWKAALYAGAYAVLKGLVGSRVGKKSPALPDT